MTAPRVMMADTPGGPLREIPAKLLPGVAGDLSELQDCAKVKEDVRSGKLKAAPDTCIEILREPIEGDYKKDAPRDLQAKMAPLPDECAQEAADEVWLATSRTYACSYEILLINVYRTSGALIGQLNLRLVQAAELNVRSTNVELYMFAWVWDVWGSGYPSSVQGAVRACEDNCTASTTSWTYNSIDTSWIGRGTMSVNGVSKGVIRDADTGWNLTFNYPRPIFPSSQTLPVTGVAFRCDNAGGLGALNMSAGCTYSNVPATIGFSQATMPNLVWHMYDAQVSGLPGRLGSGTYLQRLTNDSLIGANRRSACPTSLTRPSGFECDEYPFASSYQGASMNGPVIARSFDNCNMPDPERTGSTGFSRCFVPNGENSAQGSTLSTAIANERLLDGDSYEIGYLP